MIKKIYILLLILFVSSSLFAQRLDKEKIETLKIAYLTERLDLSTSEAEKFWPIYNEFHNKVYEIKKESANLRKEMSTNPNLNDEETKKILLHVIQLNKDKNLLETDYFLNLLEILSAKKVLTAIESDRNFKRKLIEEYRERHKELQKKHKSN